MTLGKERCRSSAYCIHFYLTSSRKDTTPWRSPCYFLYQLHQELKTMKSPIPLFEIVFSPWLKWLPTSNAIFLLSASSVTLSGCIELGFWGRYFRHVNSYPFIICFFALQFLRKIGKISISMGSDSQSLPMSNNQGYLEGLFAKQETNFLSCCSLLHSEWQIITKNFNKIYCSFLPFFFFFTSGIPELQHESQYYFTFLLPYPHLFEGWQLQHDLSGELHGDLPVTLYQRETDVSSENQTVRDEFFSFIKGWRSNGTVFLIREALQCKTRFILLCYSLAFCSKW